MTDKTSKLRILRTTAAFVAGTAIVMTTACDSSPDIKMMDQIQMGSQLKVLSTDKASYKPGEDVHFNLTLQDGTAAGGTFHIRYKHLDQIIGHETKTAKSDKLSWSWKPPEVDNEGYLAEVVLEKEGMFIGHKNIAVDVSSDWGKFPRYGYLADFPAMSQEEMSAVIDRLNLFHINGIQFYDWQFKHQDPVPYDGSKPARQWKDIANRPVNFSTVKNYIDLVHNHGMKAMSYNLLFGAYADAEQDGVKKEWGLYKDSQHNAQDKHRLPKDWASDIYLYDPSNPDWQSYLVDKEKKAFESLPFDGWQVDQLGVRGPLWTYGGKSVKLAATFPEFLKKAKEKLNIDYVMNAVGQYGQDNIASQAPVKFLYTEVWKDHPGYQQLKEVIDQNGKLSGNRLNTVLAAYMNYQFSNNPGQFNMPGILFTDAVIFASGGSHLELGENMLSKEYFPHKNLKISPVLDDKLLIYYDFLVAYQNLLRDKLYESALRAEGTDSLAISDHAEKGKVWSFAKQKDGKDILHFINFTDASTMEWNDSNGTQTEPAEKQNVMVSVKTDKPVAKIWFASPDYYGGSAISLDFQQQDGKLELKLPKLKYWDMVVVEYKEG
jgi:dextranase